MSSWGWPHRTRIMVESSHCITKVQEGLVLGRRFCSSHWWCGCHSAAKSRLTLRSYGLQHTRLLCPLLSPSVCSHACPLSQWCYLAVPSSAAPSPCAFKLSQHAGETKLGQQSGAPVGASGKESACQCWRPKRPGFNPWVGKIPWRRVWQLTPVFLPGESHGQWSLVGYSPKGCKELDWSDWARTGREANLPTVEGPPTRSLPTRWQKCSQSHLTLGKCFSSSCPKLLPVHIYLKLEHRPRLCLNKRRPENPWCKLLWKFHSMNRQKSSPDPMCHHVILRIPSRQNSQSWREAPPDSYRFRIPLLFFPDCAAKLMTCLNHRIH